MLITPMHITSYIHIQALCPFNILYTYSHEAITFSPTIKHGAHVALIFKVQGNLAYQIPLIHFS